MKKFLLVSIMCIAVAFSAAQDTKSLYRLHINHADPQLIYQLLRGITNFQTPPEMSSQMGLTLGNGGFGGSGFGGGGRNG